MESCDQIIEKCRICEVSVADGDFVSLFITNENVFERTYSGELFEELIQLPTTDEPNYPYICNGCDLQIKLFKRLKEKAWKREAAKSVVDKDAVETIDMAECVERTKDVEEADFLETNSIIYRVEEDNSASNSNLEQCISEKDTTENQSDDLVEPPDCNNFFIMYETGGDPLQSVNIDDLIELDNGDGVVDEENGDEKFEAQIVVISRNEDQLDTSHTASEENLKSKKNPIENLTNSTQVECKDCGLNFSNLRSLKAHRQEQHGRSHLCNVCQKLFKTAENLEGHYRIHLGLPAYECEACNKTFNQKVHYQYHMRKHSNKRDFACGSCEKSYFSKSDLITHIKRAHEGEKNFVCQFKACGKRFFYEQHLKYHSYVHSGQKSFECDVCQQRFKAPNSLAMHKKTIHSTESRFTCSQCGKSFRRKHHLEGHLDLHANQNESSQSGENSMINRKINILKRKPQVDFSSKEHTQKADVSGNIDESILETLNDDSNDNFLMDAIGSCSEVDNTNEANSYSFC